MNSDSQANGQQPAQEADLQVFFDPETQGVRVQINNEKVKNWDYAQALLVMATEAIKFQSNVQKSKLLQQQMMQAQNDAQLARKLQMGCG